MDNQVQCLNVRLTHVEFCNDQTYLPSVHQTSVWSSVVHGLFQMVFQQTHLKDTFKWRSIDLAVTLYDSWLSRRRHMRWSIASTLATTLAARLGETAICMSASSTRIPRTSSATRFTFFGLYTIKQSRSSPQQDVHGSTKQFWTTGKIHTVPQNRTVQLLVFYEVCNSLVENQKKPPPHNLHQFFGIFCLLFACCLVPQNCTVPLLVFYEVCNRLVENKKKPPPHNLHHFFEHYLFIVCMLPGWANAPSGSQFLGFRVHAKTLGFYNTCPPAWSW